MKLPSTKIRSPRPNLGIKKPSFGGIKMPNIRGVINPLKLNK